MTRALTVALLAAAAGAAGTGAASGGTEPDSGVHGDVKSGPTCPGPSSIPPQPGCEDRPYQTVIRIRELPEGDLVKKVKSGEKGRFHARLEPGRYRLIPRSGKNGFPRCGRTDVTVKAHTFTRVHLECDTGIR
jgi:hypothetical protein